TGYQVGLQRGIRALAAEPARTAAVEPEAEVLLGVAIAQLKSEMIVDIGAKNEAEADAFAGLFDRGGAKVCPHIGGVHSLVPFLAAGGFIRFRHHSALGR